MIKPMRIFAFFSLMAFAAGAWPVGSALSQAIDLDKINIIPRYSKMTAKEYEAKSVLYEEIPQGDRHLQYEMRLPKGWQRLGLGEEVHSSAPEKKVAPAKDKFDISNLRDEHLAEEATGRKKDNEDDVDDKMMEIEDVGAMASKRLQNSRDMVVPDKSDVRLLGPIARYVGPANMLALSRIEISAMQISHDITARNWFLNYILGRNYTLTGMEQVAANRVEAEYVMIEKGISYVVRTAAISNGHRMVLISYFVPEKFWDKEKDLQEMAVNSFRFINPEKTVVDDKRTHGFLDLVKFSYPTSWKLIAPNIFSVDNMSAKLLYSVDATTLQGEIDVNLISTELDTNLMKEVEYIRTDLKKKGLGIGDALDTNATYKFDDRITFSRVEAYSVAGQKKEFIDYEFWLAIMVEDRYYYIVTMLTPGRKSDFYTWARNTETFAYVIQSLVPQTAGETLDETFIKRKQEMDSGGAALLPQTSDK